MKRFVKSVVAAPLLVLLVISGFTLNGVAAQERAADGRGASAALELLDRSDASPFLGPGMTATLSRGAATPGVTMVGVLNVTVTMAPAYQGNFFAPVADFPTSWYPFDVTGAYAWGGMLPFAPTVMVGVGVAPGPFTGGGGTMWAAFGSAMLPAPIGMTPMVFGGPGLFSAGVLPVSASPLGVACGLFADPVGGPFLGGLTMAPSTALVYTFNGPPIGDFLAMGPPAFIQYVAGCFLSGATVPVELQSFDVD